MWLLPCLTWARDLSTAKEGEYKEGTENAEEGMLDYPVLMTVATQKAYDTLAPGPQNWRPWESPTPGPWWHLEKVDAPEALLLAHADAGDVKPPYLVNNFTRD